MIGIDQREPEPAPELSGSGRSRRGKREPRFLLYERGFLQGCLTFALYSGALARAHLFDQDRSACGVARWSDAKPLSTTKPANVARFPSIGSYNGTIYVVGNDIRFFDGSHVRASPIALWEIRNKPRAIQPPPGEFTFRFPKAVVDSRERLHLFWGEPATRQPTQAFRWPSVPIATVWRATYERKSGWSKPERIEVGSRIEWNPTSSSDALIAGGRDILVVMQPTDSRSGLTLFRSLDNTWDTTTVPAKGAYVALANRGKQVFLAFVAPAPDYQRDLNSVFVMRSDDEGLSWNAPRLVSRSGDQGAFELHLVPAPDGSLHLVWVQDLGKNRSAIRTRSSSDAGAHWSAPDDLPINAPPGMAALVVSADACNGVDAVFENWENGPEDKRLEYAHWSSGWSAPRRLFPHNRVGDGMIERIRKDRVLLVFLAQEAKSNPRSPMSMLYSEGIALQKAP